MLAQRTRARKKKKEKERREGKGKGGKKLRPRSMARVFVSKKKRKKDLLNLPEKPAVSRTIAFLFPVEKVVGWLERFRE